MGAPATMDVRLLPKTQAVGDYVLGRPNPIINEMTGEGASLFSQNTTARCAEVGPEVFSTANQCTGAVPESSKRPSGGCVATLADSGW